MGGLTTRRGVRGHPPDCPGRQGQSPTTRNEAASRWHGAPLGRAASPLATLAPAYRPRRPTETALYAAVREHLETFLAHARETYDAPLPRYVEQELRAYLRCGVFAHGFVRAHCDGCGHDLLVAFSCKGRGVCPSCAGRRMASTAAHLVDRVLPVVPVRQWVLSLPFELRALAATQADVLTALSRIFAEALSARYRAGARADGIAGAQTGAVTFVQRFGSSLNLNVHFHVMVLDGVFARGAGGRAVFHPAAAPCRRELEDVVRRVRARASSWLSRRRHRDDHSGTPLAACAAIAMQRGTVKALGDPDSAGQTSLMPQAPPRDSDAVEIDGFNLHASVAIAAGDDSRPRTPAALRRPSSARTRPAPPPARRQVRLPHQDPARRARQAANHDSTRAPRPPVGPRASPSVSPGAVSRGSGPEVVLEARCRSRDHPMPPRAVGPARTAHAPHATAHMDTGSPRGANPLKEAA